MADTLTDPMAEHEGFGARLQERLDALVQRAGRHPLGTLALGGAVAAGVVLGGFGAFILLWALLVGVLN